MSDHPDDLLFRAAFDVVTAANAIRWCGFGALTDRRIAFDQALERLRVLVRQQDGSRVGQ